MASSSATAAAKSASTRVRRAFRYPSDEDDTGAPEVMDEQEQEEIIQEIVTQDAGSRNAFRKFFVVLTALLLLVYILMVVFTLLLPDTPGLSKILQMVLGTAITVLSFSMACAVPTSDPSGSSLFAQRHARKTRDKALRSALTTFDRAEVWARKNVVDRFISREAKDWFGAYAVYTNAALCGALLFLSLLVGDDDHGGRGGFNALWPAVVGVPLVTGGNILLAWRELRPLDVSELETLRYEYKGA